MHLKPSICRPWCVFLLRLCLMLDFPVGNQPLALVNRGFLWVKFFVQIQTSGTVLDLFRKRNYSFLKQILEQIRKQPRLTGRIGFIFCLFFDVFLLVFLLGQTIEKNHRNFLWFFLLFLLSGRLAKKKKKNTVWNKSGNNQDTGLLDSNTGFQ